MVKMRHATCFWLDLCCLQAQGEVLNFDVMMETLRATSLGGLQTGSRVNFERAAKFGDEVRWFAILIYNWRYKASRWPLHGLNVWASLRLKFAEGVSLATKSN
eukprot:1139861-Pelagomonas_calceolata.AAC.2